MPARALLAALCLCLLAVAAAATGGAAASADGPDASGTEQLGPHAPGRLLVGFAASTSEREREAIIERLAGRRLEALDPEVAAIKVAKAAPGQSVSAAITALEGSDAVRYAEPDQRVSSAIKPNEGASYWRSWQHDNYGQRITLLDGTNVYGTPDADEDTEQAWDQETGSADVLVGVVDTGIDHTHPDLDANVWLNPGESGAGRESNGLDDDGNGFVDDVRGWSVARGSGNVTDSDGHGTAVSGVIGAEGNNGIGTAGVAWDVSLLSAQWSVNGSGWDSAVVAALAYAADSGARVINGSLSGGLSLSERAVIAAHPNTLFVFAAGNDGYDQDVANGDPCSAPGENVICVAASTPTDELASWSSYGAVNVDLAAPGAGIYSTGAGGGYVIGDGTSLAAPQVAGAAALIYSQHPDARAWWVRERILGTVDQKPAFAGKVATGGRLNVAAAVAPVSDTSAPETTIETGPPALLRSGERAEFTYSADEPAEFECRLDGASWVRCPLTRVRYDDLAVGAHDFEVRAIDGLGNVDPSPADRSFTVAVVPETTITTASSGRSRATTAAFTYSSDVAGASFECRLDTGSWQGCPGSGVSYTGLAEGTHSFAVRAGAAGLTDPSPATASWEIDTTAPTATIETAPSSPANSRNAAFTYSADDQAATFRCRLDSGPWQSCPRAGVSYTGLTDGDHMFELTARDDLGNESAPLGHGWTVDARVPATTLDEPAISGRSASFNYSSDAVGDSFECRLVGATDSGWQSCPAGGVGYSDLADGDYVFSVRARAANGNADPTPASHSWTVAEDPPPVELPETVISFGPKALTNQSGVSFGLVGSAGATGFQCRIDDGGWFGCTSPTPISGLADGYHRFEARAHDAAMSFDPTPARYDWRQDTAAPETTITAHPKRRSKARRVRFAYEASERNASFKCRLDRKPWRGCSSLGIGYRVSPGRHSFAVRASDRAGNSEPTAASYSFRIVKKTRKRPRP